MKRAFLVIIAVIFVFSATACDTQTADSAHVYLQADKNAVKAADLVGCVEKVGDSFTDVQSGNQATGSNENNYEVKANECYFFRYSSYVGSIMFSHYYHSDTKGYYLGLVEVISEADSIDIRDFYCDKIRKVFTDEMSLFTVYKCRVIKQVKADKEYGGEVYIAICKYDPNNKRQTQIGDIVLACCQVYHFVNDYMVVYESRVSLTRVDNDKIISDSNRLLKDCETVDEAFENISAMFDDVEPRAKAKAIEKGYYKETE